MMVHGLLPNSTNTRGYPILNQPAVNVSRIIFLHTRIVSLTVI